VRRDRKNALNQPTSAQRETARRLLAQEGAANSPAEAAAAAGRAFDKLHAHLAPLIGAAGVQALLVRSAMLRHGEFSFLEASILENATKLRECLQAQEATVATEAAAALLETFFALITTFIGERLTTQALRGAWPMLEATPPSETR